MPNTASQASSAPCPLCGIEAFPAFQKHGFSIFRCNACSFAFVHPEPSHKARDLYGGDYFMGARGGFGYMNYEEDKIAMRPFFERVLDRIGDFRPAKGDFLDIGAATGFFMRLAEARGWRVRGVEVSDYACAKAQASGLVMHCGPLESANFEPGSFDAVTLIDVVEHVPSPKETLKECWRIMKPGAVIFINAPDAASLWARFFGRRWHAYCPPEHLSYFSVKSLSNVLRGQGFDILDTGKIAKRFTPAYTASMLYRWQGFGFWDRLSKYLERSRLNSISIPIDIRDNFYAIARRKNGAPSNGHSNRL